MKKKKIEAIKALIIRKDPPGRGIITVNGEIRHEFKHFSDVEIRVNSEQAVQSLIKLMEG